MSWKVGGVGGGGGAFRRVTESSSFCCQSSSKFLPAAVANTHLCSCQTYSSFRRFTGFPFLSEADRRSLFFAAVSLILPQLSAFPFLSGMATFPSFPRLSGLPFFSGFLTLVICHFLSATFRIILPFHSCQLLLPPTDGSCQSHPPSDSIQGHSPFESCQTHPPSDSCHNHRPSDSCQNHPPLDSG